MYILTLETTCDETAAAVVTDELQVLGAVVASQDKLHERFHGVVPEIAARAHLEQILPIIDEAPRETVDQAVPSLGSFEQDGAAIRTRVLLIKGGDERAIEEIWEENSLWYRVGHNSDASVVAKGPSARPLVPRGGVSVFAEIGPFEIGRAHV